MLMKSKKLFWKTLVCSTFISTSALIMSNNAYAKAATPNEAIDDMTDITRARRYYQARESRGNAQTEEEKEASVDTTEEEIKLPPRTNKYAPSVHIYRVDISDSEVFSSAEVNKFKSLIEKKDVTIEDINNLVKLINAQYLKKGFITARAFITEGKLEGVLKIELMEAHIGKLAIDGNKYNREWYLRSQFSHKDGDLFSLQDLQNELKTFNKNARSIKMRAQLKPGEEYGTTDVTLKAEETMPYHLSASFDNFGRDTTGEHRGGLVASTDSLIGFQDRLSVAFNVAKSSFNPYIDYNVPVNRYGTRAGVSYMFGKSKVTSGEYKDFDLNAKTNTYSGYISHPLIDTTKGKLNVNTSLNYKTSTSKISGFKYSDFRDTNVAIGLGGNYNFEKSVL